MTLLRLNGLFIPLRVTTESNDSSRVVKRREHSGQDRRRRIAWPSSTSRESMTRESGYRQNGHRMWTLPPARDRRSTRPVDRLLTALWMVLWFLMRTDVPAPICLTMWIAVCTTGG